MSKYDMLCTVCGEVEIEHSMHEDHPKTHGLTEGGVICVGKLARYFGNQRRPTIKFKPSRGGGVDDWASVRIDRQPETSVESETPYE